MRKAVDNTNCLDTGASITLVGRSLMKKMNLTPRNLFKDNTRVSAGEGSCIKVLGFLPAKLRIQHEGATLETLECIYFTDGVFTTLVSLGALKNLKCVPEDFPLPPSDVVFSLTKKDDEEYEEKDEKEAKPRQPKELLFPTTEENHAQAEGLADQQVH